MHCTRAESGKETLWSQTLKNWSGWTRLNSTRLNAKEMSTPQRSELFIFLVADGTVKNSWGDQDLRTSTFTRERQEWGEEQEILQGKSDELDSPTTTSRRLDAGWWESWRWLLDDHRRIHFSSSRCAPSQTARAKRRKISYSDGVHRRYQNNIYFIGVGEKLKQASGDSSYWTKSHLMGTHGPGGTHEENIQPQDPTMYGQICGNICLMYRKRKKNKDGLSRSSTMPDS